MTRLLPQPSPMQPEGQHLRMLRELRVERAGVDGSSGDAALAVEFFRRRLASAGFLSPHEAREAAAAYARDNPAWHRALHAEADRLCGVGLPIYALQAGPLSGGLHWPALAVGPHGDRLYRLRPHRFGFLPRLALAALVGADTLPALHATLARWLRHTETSQGADDAYFSNLVVVYRLLAISWAAPFLAARAEDGDEVAAGICLQLFRILAADCHYLLPRLGGSVANNHLLADRFAAWALAACYAPLLPHSQQDEALEEAWHAELRRQFQQDGTNFEQSLHYHELGCEMALAYLVICLRQGKTPPDSLFELIGAMLRLQAAMTDGGGNGFALGDSTDDPLLPLDAGGGWGRGAWRILYRELFDPAFPVTEETAAGAERAHWLLTALRPVGRRRRLTSCPRRLGQPAVFPEGGYVVFRDGGGDDILLFRSGPRPGAAIRPGHAMSDFLAVYWNVSGQAVLEPAGTYSYAADRAPPGGGPASPRDYFRSPAAHNGPVLRGHDPLGLPKGRFRGHDSGARAISRWNGLEDVLTWSEAQLQEPGPLNGWRRGVLRIPGHYTLVYDRVPALPDPAHLACHWQFAPEAAVRRPSDRQAIAQFPTLSAYVCASQEVATVDCETGRAMPAAGWVSRRYGQLQSAPQLICRVAPNARAVAFVIGVAGTGELPEPEIAAAHEEGTAVIVHQGPASAFCVIGRLSGCLRPGLDVDFEGDALWLRFDGERCVEMRTLGLRRIASAGLDLELTAAEPRRDPCGWRRLACEHGAGGLSGRWKREPAPDRLAAARHRGKDGQ